MLSKIVKNYFEVKMAVCILIVSVFVGVALAEDPAVYIWDGGGDGVNWADSANWDNDIVPFGSHVPLYRPDIHILADGDDVLVNSNVPDLYGHIQINSIAAGVSGSATLRIEDGANLTTGGSIYAGEAVNGSTKAGHFKMTGGALTIGVYGARDLSISNGTMEFGSAMVGTAPVFINNSRGFYVGNQCDGDVTFSGYGDFSVVGDVTLGGYRNYVRDIDVIGGNLSIEFATGGGLSNLSNQTVYISRYNQGTTSINYTLDAAGASTINCGADVVFGNGSLFTLALDESFAADLGDIFTIIDAGGSFTGNGKFDNILDGDILAVGDYEFRANYNSDSGSTFTVTVVPEPATFAFLLVGGLYMRRRKLSA